jgi:hypothetical protein
VSRVSDVIHTPRIGLEAARMIAGWKADAAVGIVDRGEVAAGIVDDLRTGGAGLALRDATALFATARAEADPAEIALAAHAGSIAQRALACAAGETLAQILAAVEAQARALGAEEIYLAAAPDLSRDRRFVRVEGEASLGERFALRATVAYKGSWIRLTRTFASTIDGTAAARFAAAVATLPSERGFAGFSSWLVEGCRTTQPLAPLVGSRLPDGTAPMPRSLVSVQASLDIDGSPQLIGAPVLLGAPGESASLLVAL